MRISIHLAGSLLSPGSFRRVFLQPQVVSLCTGMDPPSTDYSKEILSDLWGSLSVQLFAPWWCVLWTLQPWSPWTLSFTSSFWGTCWALQRLPLSVPWPYFRSLPAFLSHATGGWGSRCLLALVMCEYSPHRCFNYPACPILPPLSWSGHPG